WGAALGGERGERLGLDPARKAGKLSGGQRAQLALTLGIAKRPELLILDEPVASLDPLARREFLQDLMEAVAEHELSVVLSSHLVSDLERVCDHLIVLVASRVRLAGDIDTLLATHRRLVGPPAAPAPLPPGPPGQPPPPPPPHKGAPPQPHRAPDHAPGPHRGPDLRPGLDRRRDRPRGPRPGLHGPAGSRSRSPPHAGGPAVIWLTWRQFRASAAMMAAAPALAAAILALTGPGLADDYSAAIGGCATQGDGCSDLVERFFDDHRNAFLAVTAVV